MSYRKCVTKTKDRDEIYFEKIVRVHQHPGSNFGVVKNASPKSRTGMFWILMIVSVPFRSYGSKAKDPDIYSCSTNQENIGLNLRGS